MGTQVVGVLAITKKAALQSLALDGFSRREDRKNPPGAS